MQKPASTSSSFTAFSTSFSLAFVISSASVNALSSIVASEKYPLASYTASFVFSATSASLLSASSSAFDSVPMKPDISITLGANVAAPINTAIITVDMMKDFAFTKFINSNSNTVKKDFIILHLPLLRICH